MAAYPAGVIGTTKENLKAAADGELMEWGTLYPTFAGTAKDEGFAPIANLFRQVAVVEKYHEQRYNRLLTNLEKGTVFKRDAPVKWYCRECGYVYEGTTAPAKCPACGHPQAYFEILRREFLKNSLSFFGPASGECTHRIHPIRTHRSVLISAEVPVLFDYGTEVCHGSLSGSPPASDRYIRPGPRLRVSSRELVRQVLRHRPLPVPR